MIQTIPDPVNADDNFVTQYTHKDTVKGQSYNNLNCVGRWYFNVIHEKKLYCKTKYFWLRTRHLWLHYHIVHGQIEKEARARTMSTE
jgi:hypothetical protein